MHIVELPTAVVELDTKIIKVSLTQNQCLFTMCNAAILRLRPRDAAEPNNDGMTKLGDVHYQTEAISSIFLKEI